MRVPMDLNKIEQGVRLILEGIDEDLDREGLVDTPCRTAKSIAELCRGMDPASARSISTFHAEGHDDLVIVKDISFASICEHHLLPYVGRCDVVYLPADSRIAGLSAIVETVETMAARLTTQERLTTEIADRLMQEIQAKGVMVVMEAEHMCLAIRGVRKRDSRIVTSAMRGYLRRLPTRTEALALIGRSTSVR
ncbi:MAG: GTP cyclohydrolase I [Candidatus Fermentibacter daniensis]|nr:GTP cyclohydrolase I [Candidatus Fermentibacter daniensis]